MSTKAHSTGIEKRALSGVVAGGVAFAVTLTQALVTVPILLSHWGKDSYGLWLAFSASTSLLATLDTGHQAYLGNCFNQDLPRGEAVLRQRLASGIQMALVLGGAQVLVALALVFTGTLPRLLGVEPGAVESGQVGFAFVSTVANWAAYGSLAGILVRIYPPYGMYAISQWVGIGQRVVQLALLIGVAAFGGYLVAYSWAQWAIAAVFWVVWYRSFKRFFPNLHPWWKGGSWRLSWENFTHSSVLTVNGFIAQFSQSGLSLLIAARFDPGMVALFATLRTVANTFAQASQILTNPISPDLVRFHLNGEESKLEGAFKACWFAGGGIINLGLILSLPLVPTLYEIWTRGRIEYNAGLFALLAWSVAIRTAYSPLAAYVTGLNRLRAQFILTTTQTALTLVVPLAVAFLLGINAFGVGVVVGEIVVMFGYTWYAAREMGKQFGAFLKVFLSHAVLPTVVVGLALAGGLTEPWIGASISGVLALALGIFYYRQWSSLPRELRQRFARLVPARFRGAP